MRLPRQNYGTAFSRRLEAYSPARGAVQPGAEKPLRVNALPKGNRAARAGKQLEDDNEAPMALILFLLFLLTPLVEIAVFIKVGGLIGLWPTLGVVIFTAVLGAALWRAQGLSTWAKARASLDRGELPVREVTDGAFLLVAGALLLTPGLVTDSIGFLLLVPPIRRWLAKIILRYLRDHAEVHVVNGGGRPRGPRGGPYGGPTIDGEAHERDS
jgi:UPF0716 protein FxsA